MINLSLFFNYWRKYLDIKEQNYQLSHQKNVSTSKYLET